MKNYKTLIIYVTPLDFVLVVSPCLYDGPTPLVCEFKVCVSNECA